MRTILLFCLFILLVPQLNGAIAAPATVDQETAEPEAMPANDTAFLLDRKMLEARLGRKLKFTERIVFGIMQRKVKRKQKRMQQTDYPTDGFATASFIAGISSFLLLLSGNALCLLLSPLAIIFGIVGLIRINNNPGFRKGKGLAIIGLLAGILVAALIVVLVALFIGAFS